ESPTPESVDLRLLAMAAAAQIARVSFPNARRERVQTDDCAIHDCRVGSYRVRGAKGSADDCEGDATGADIEGSLRYGGQERGGAKQGGQGRLLIEKRQC